VTVAHQAPAPPVETALHRLAPEVKVAAVIVFVVSEALVPRGVWWPYAVDLALLAVIALWARVPPALLGNRLLVELPFVAFVVLLPFVSRGPEVDFLGIALSRPGLVLAGSIVCKATLAVLATGVLAAITSPAAIVGGLGRLRVPAIVTSIAALALRYVQLAFEDLRRARQARLARGDDPRWLWQARATARGFGGMAARSLARGERVHAAMLARGFEGRVPVLTLSARGTTLAWAAAAAALAPALAATGFAIGGLR
jgi:cobalt/nickel transport system permease protein